MASEYIGLICGVMTRTVYAVLNPDEDTELDNPQMLLLQNDEKEPVRMIKVPREDYGLCATPQDVENLLVKYYVTSSKVYEGPERLLKP